MAVVLISGGSGLVGKALTRKLLSENHEVRILSRKPVENGRVKQFYWNVNKSEMDERAFENVDHLVHLAGAGIADERWTGSRKKEILDSRIKSMELLESMIMKRSVHLKSFVGASAIGFYGMNSTEKIYRENDYGGNDFLSEVCLRWENAYRSMTSYADKTCVIRTSVVLSAEGGALQKLVPLFKSGLGSALGSGKQYMPWIHISDLVSIYMSALFDPDFIGIYNASATEMVTNREFSRRLAMVLGKPYFMPSVPGFALKMIVGQMAGLLLTGSRVSNHKLLDAGFKFQYESLQKALEQLLVDEVK